MSPHAIDEYDITIAEPCVCVMSRVNCGDITMLGYKRSSLATMVNWAFEDYLQWVCFVQGITWHARNKTMYGLLWMIFFVTHEVICNDFHCVTKENHCRIASLVTKEIIIQVSHTLLYVSSGECKQRETCSQLVNKIIFMIVICTLNKKSNNVYAAVTNCLCAYLMLFNSLVIYKQME